MDEVYNMTQMVEIVLVDFVFGSFKMTFFLFPRLGFQLSLDVSYRCGTLPSCPQRNLGVSGDSDLYPKLFEHNTYS